MPELPEVETCVRELGPQLAGRRIVRAQVFWPRTIAQPDAGAFATQIEGLRFGDYGRRGKYMLFTLEHASPTQTSQTPYTLIVHLRMTGKLILAPDRRAGDGEPTHATPATETPDAETPDAETAHAKVARDKHTHVVFDLDLGAPTAAQLLFVDPRKFGRIWLTPAPDQVLAKLGPEPLSPDFTPAGLGQRLARRQAAIKALLLDQSIVAGVGNIYADEALFHAGIHPTQPGGTLGPNELARLHASICELLTQAIAHQGSSLGGSALQNYVRPSGATGGFQEEHRVFRRTGLPCPACQTAIARIVIAQRSTHYCPTCQILRE